MREVMIILGGLAAIVVGLTFLSGGGFTLGTGAAGPYANFTYKGFH